MMIRSRPEHALRPAARYLLQTVRPTSSTRAPRAPHRVGRPVARRPRVQRQVAELAVGHQRPVDEQGAADTGAQGDASRRHPLRPRPAPKRISAIPAASASFDHHRPARRAAEELVGVDPDPRAGSMLAAVSTIPSRMTDGRVSPTGPGTPIWSSTSSTTLRDCVGGRRMGGEDPDSVADQRPAPRSTGAPLMPVPPMSTPST